MFLQKLAPTWDELAAKMGADGKATIAKVDCTKSQSLCQEHGIKGYPTLAYFRFGHSNLHFFSSSSLSLSLTHEGLFALQGPSTRLVRCFRNYRETRTLSGVPR